MLWQRTKFCTYAAFTSTVTSVKVTVLIQAFQIILLFRLSSDTLSRWVGAFLRLGVILFAYKRGLSELQRGQTAPRLTGPLTDGALQYVGWSVMKPTWEESTVFLLHFEKRYSSLFPPPSSHPLISCSPLRFLSSCSILLFDVKKKKRKKIHPNFWIGAPITLGCLLGCQTFVHVSDQTFLIQSAPASTSY